MLKLGEKIINKLYLGDKAISKAYLGEKLVFQAGEFVESIVFDGKSCILTGVPFQNCTLETLIQFENTGTRQLMGFNGASGYWWGAEPNGLISNIANTNAFQINKVNVEWVIDNSSSTFKRTITINDLQTSIYNGTTVLTTSYIMGALSSSATLYPVYGRIYYNKFYDGEGNLIQDLRPYVDADGVVCFYDMVTGTKFYNQGTGTLKGRKLFMPEFKQLYGWIRPDNIWEAASSANFSVVYPVKIGEKYTLSFDNTEATVVGTIFRIGFTDDPEPKNQLLQGVIRSTPQDTPSLTVEAVAPYMVVQVGSNYGNTTMKEHLYIDI